jgi:U3 small nucleolar RNA-associated protein 10
LLPRSSSQATFQLAGYVSLAALSQRCHLSPQGLVAVIAEMVKGQQRVNSLQVLPFFIAVVAPQEQLDEFSDSTTDTIINLPSVSFLK